MVLDAAFAIPGDIDTVTGGYRYARRVLSLLPEFGVTAHHIALPGAFPTPSDADLAITRRLLEQLHPSTPVLFDGLAYGALPPGFAADLASPIIALVHHPLGLESGLMPTRQRQLLASERAALRHAEAVITTSPLTARVLGETFDVEAERVTVAIPGTPPATRSIGTGTPFQILAVGSLIPRKGYAVLIEALAQLADDDWHLTIVGSPDHDPGEANRVREAVLASGRRRQITLAGEVPGADLSRLYARADLFVMPSLYEGYGMVLAEALARGLAIVCTTGGAAAETVPDGAAIKVPPGEAAALGEAIDAVMRDPAQRTKIANASWTAGRDLPQWPDTVRRIADVIKAVHREHAP